MKSAGLVKKTPLLTAIDACDSSPCADSGSCVDNVDGFQCRCKKGFYGDLCEYERDDCSPNPCVHGHCIDHVDSFECSCESGYEGDTCGIGKCFCT